MDLNFDRANKVRMSGTRFTEEEFKLVKQIAARYQQNMSETIRALVLAGIRAIGKKSPKPTK